MSHEQLLEFVQIVTNIVLAGATTTLCWQLVIMKRQFNEEHRIQRNIYSNTMIRWWAEQIKREMAAARSFVESLSDDQCRCLVESSPFTISLDESDDASKKHRIYLLNKLRVCLESHYTTSVKEGNPVIEIGTDASNRIRSLCVSYLNSVEIVMSAWRHNLTDRAIIEEEFKYIVHLGKKYELLSTFRKASGGIESFPAIYEYIDHFNKNENHLSPGSPQAKSH